jgi:hypothetical protein
MCWRKKASLACGSRARTATVIPDNERWLHEPKAAADFQAALAWSVSHPPTDADVDDTLRRLSADEA